MADFSIVYIKEAHPSDGWQMRSNEREGVIYKDPRTLEDRRKVAKDCIEQLDLKLPAVLDGMDDAMAKAYNAWPNRVYILGGDGVIYYKGPWGPRGVSGATFEGPLDRLLALPGGGRFTDIPPTVGLLAGTPVDAAALTVPRELIPQKLPGVLATPSEGGFFTRVERKPGAAFRIDRDEAIATARELLRTSGILSSPIPGEEARVGRLGAVDDEGSEVRSRDSRLFELRFDHYFENARLTHDEVAVVFDRQGVRELRGAWHRLDKLEVPAGTARRSSLEAGRLAEMMKGIASLCYVPRKGGDGTTRFHPIWRLLQGREATDVDVLD